MSPALIERSILARMAEDNLLLAADFVHIGNTTAAHGHINSALSQLNQLEALTPTGSNIPAQGNALGVTPAQFPINPEGVAPIDI